MHTGGIFDDRKSPVAPADSLSGSTSPHIIKPPVINTRPRSSSINSNGSNQSNNTRSLSIASLESPRNSIVSIDDGFLKSSTRNNSTASLSSLAGSTTPKNNQQNTATNTHLIKDRFLFNHSKLKPASINSAVLMSDDDSEAEPQRLMKPKFKSRSNSNNSMSNPESPSPSSSLATINIHPMPDHNLSLHPPTSIHNHNLNINTGGSHPRYAPKKTDRLMLKKDYRFKFSDISKTKAEPKLTPSTPDPNPPSPSLPSLPLINTSSPHINTSTPQSRNTRALAASPSTPVETPSPLSLNVHENLPTTTIEQNRENYKKKSSLKQPVQNLKKNLLFSKDVRLELLANRDVEGLYGSKFLTQKKDITKDNTPSTPSTLPDNNFTPTSSLALSPQVSPTNSVTSSGATPPSNNSSRNSISAPSTSSITKKSPKQPGSKEFNLLSNIKNQNQLISKLNQKWNKLDKSLSDKDQKRSKRRYSSTDEEIDF